MGVVLAVLMAVSVVFAALHGRIPELSHAALNAATDGAGYALGLVGALALWTGLMNIAQEAGALRWIGRAAAPLLRRLFRGVPDGHPAMSAIVMNFAANFLGLGNAATPFGLQAMKELETLNPDPGTATDAQVMLCALNTASVQLVPISVLALRVKAGSQAPEAVVVPTILASACGVVVAVLAARVLARLFPPRQAR
jgi:spore maturation protein A